jgi:hypothetical protein
MSFCRTPFTRVECTTRIREYPQSIQAQGAQLDAVEARVTPSQKAREPMVDIECVVQKKVTARGKRWHWTRIVTRFHRISVIRLCSRVIVLSMPENYHRGRGLSQSLQISVRIGQNDARSFRRSTWR